MSGARGEKRHLPAVSLTSVSATTPSVPVAGVVVPGVVPSVPPAASSVPVVPGEGRGWGSA